MIQHILLKLLPKRYNFSDKKWYTNLNAQKRLFQERLLLSFYSLALTITLLFLINDLLENHKIALFPYIISFLIEGFGFIHLLRYKDIITHNYLAILLCLVGFTTTLLIPETNNMYLFTFYIFPLFSLQILNIRKAIIVNVIFVSIPILTGIAIHAGIDLQWNNTQTYFEDFLSLATYFILFLLSLVTTLQNEKNIERMIRSLLFTSEYNFSNRKALECYRMDGSHHLLLILQLNNHSELRTIFGYDAYQKGFFKLADFINRRTPLEPCEMFVVNNREIVLLGKVESPKKNELEKRLLDLYTYCHEFKLQFRNTEIHPRIKIGAVCVAGKNAGEMLNMADEALKSAIDSKQDYTIFCGDTGHRAATLHSETKYNLLLDNIEKKQIHTVFQPVVCSQSGNSMFSECLCRLKDENGKAISIFPFLNIAYSTGLDRSISQIVLSEAIEQIKTTGETISINISINDLEDSTFMNQLAEIADQINPEKLILEILETTDFGDQHKMIIHLNKIKKMGFRIAIDDFGSGYSNYARLCDLPIDIVKIDGKLIKQAGTDPIALILIETIIDFCHKTGKEIVAEWIEDEKIYRLMKNRGVHLLQGFLFGKPSPKKTKTVPVS